MFEMPLAHTYKLITEQLKRAKEGEEYQDEGMSPV